MMLINCVKFQSVQILQAFLFSLSMYVCASESECRKRKGVHIRHINTTTKNELLWISCKIPLATFSIARFVDVDKINMHEAFYFCLFCLFFSKIFARFGKMLPDRISLWKSLLNIDSWNTQIFHTKTKPVKMTAICFTDINALI